MGRWRSWLAADARRAGAATGTRGGGVQALLPLHQLEELPHDPERHLHQEVPSHSHLVSTHATNPLAGNIIRLFFFSRFGEGVYLTLIPPDAGRDKIASEIFKRANKPGVGAKEPRTEVCFVMDLKLSFIEVGRCHEMEIWFSCHIQVVLCL